MLTQVDAHAALADHAVDPNAAQQVGVLFLCLENLTNKLLKNVLCSKVFETLCVYIFMF